VRALLALARADALGCDADYAANDVDRPVEAIDHRELFSAVGEANT
jgi:hypothetical protein